MDGWVVPLGGALSLRHDGGRNLVAEPGCEVFALGRVGSIDITGNQHLCQNAMRVDPDVGARGISVPNPNDRE